MNQKDRRNTDIV